MPYIYNMEEVMNIADVAVTRSGAMTITEISNLGKPSILIPLPNVSADHQLYNAKVLEKIGAAKILLNDSLDANILNKTIEEIVLNKDEAQKMGERAKTKSVYNAEERIYNEIKRVLQK
jgi:UDP-N-acetylglucosamine--N-acetylmuramyl-(pentapeptide) pyrophosphoryl-undecaprenol N-acetylglucosamine transferase